MKVLIAEDDEITQLILEKLLEREGYDVVCADNGKEAWERFQKDIPDIVIIDWLMPEMDGLELCKRIRQSELPHYVYIIFLTIKYKREDIIKALNAGADDYMAKPFDPHELLYRIKTGAKVVQIDRHLKTIRKHLEDITFTDEITGALNQRGVLKRLKEELSRAKREGHSMAIVMLDIDEFKKINDEFGREVGDKVLKEVVQRVKKNIRPYDVIGRYGNDEFLIGINIPRNNKKAAYEIAKRIAQVISNEPIKANGHSLDISLSIGVNFVRTPTDDLEMMVKKADECLLEAKFSNENKIIMAET